MCSVNERIKQLIIETSYLRNEVKDLKETVIQQNELIISLLSKQNGNLDETIETERIQPLSNYDQQTYEFSRRFPLENVEDLKKFETEINNDNKTHIVSIMKSLLSPQGFTKNIVNVLSDNIIMESNVDGHFNKTRLLSFPKTLDVLHLAKRKDDDYTSQMFLEELRRTLRVVKNRCHKNNCRARQKQLLREEQEKTELEKTEEIYFD